MSETKQAETRWTLGARRAATAIADEHEKCRNCGAGIGGHSEIGECPSFSADGLQNGWYGWFASNESDERAELISRETKDQEMADLLRRWTKHETVEEFMALRTDTEALLSTLEGKI